jgi:hypothetical protein
MTSTDKPARKTPRYRLTDDSPAARAERHVPNNPRPLCRAFTPKPPLSEFWCGACGWNEPMHSDEAAREAIAAVLLALAAGVSR